MSGLSEEDEHEEISLFLAFVVYFAYGVLVAVGHVKEFFFPVHNSEKNRAGYVPLYSNFESFFSRNVYRRMSKYFNMPLAGCPGGTISIYERSTPDYGYTYCRTGKVLKCLNFGSYNYLGYAETQGECTDYVERSLRTDGVAVASFGYGVGKHESITQLELKLAEFLRKPQAIVFAMGFGTNSLNIPSLAARGCLVVSDEYNHNSIILGLRLSGATIAVFRHNCVRDLERVLRDAIVRGQPRSHRPWRKIVIFVEGVYSMEGTLCPLPAIVALKRKYRAYLFLDEAHSIGAMGPTGRGIVEYYGCDPDDVDIMMGTFTKSFGAMGGYIAGTQQLISHIRANSHAAYYCTPMAPPIVAQISCVLEQLLTGRATHRLNTLAANTRYFRRRLRQMGCIIYGHRHSPVVPLILLLPAKACEFSNQLLKRNIAAVIAGFPATNLLTIRCRFCLTAAHTKADLDRVLDAIDQIGDELGVKYSRIKTDNTQISYDI